MANPRKFSEKIALQKQKQAEGTAEFEKIMREVSDATSKLDEVQYNQLSSDGGVSPSNSTMLVHRESRGRSVGVGPMRRPSDRKVDRSPYSSGNIAYLSPPSESYWRRASSDSAIHQSLIQTSSNKHHGSHSPISLSPSSHRRSHQISSNLDHRHSLSNSINRNSSNVDLRQGLLSCSPRLPCVNVYSSPHDNSLSNSVGNNTGSLPDLSSMHFTSSLGTQLEKENEQSSSPFSSSPLTTPATLSPTSMPNRYQYSPAHSPSESNTYSPTHISSNARQEEFDHFRSSQGCQTSHLSFTNLPGLVHVQQSGNIKDANISNNHAIHGSHGHLSSIGINTTGNLTEYRTPQSRPSPGSSPGIQHTFPLSESNPSAPCSPIPQNINSSDSQTYEKYQNQSNEGYGLNQSFQNHFEQFSLVDNTASEYIPNLQTAQNSFNSLQFNESTYAQLGSIPNTNQQDHQITRDDYVVSSNANINKSEKDTNPRRNENCNLSSESPQEPFTSQHQNHYQTPTTPTSIPEIVFSDFSSGNPDFSKVYFSEIFGSLDLELGPMDVAGLQMLSDPNSTMIADPTIEDSFRRDLN